MILINDPIGLLESYAAINKQQVRIYNYCNFSLTQRLMLWTFFTDANITINDVWMRE